MTVDGVGGVSGPGGPEGPKGPQKLTGPTGPEGAEGPAGPTAMGGAGEVDRIEKAPELAQWLEKIQQLPDGESPAAGSISGIDPDSWGPEDEQRIQQMIERILEEGI